jgi:hypothetical protein
MKKKISSCDSWLEGMFFRAGIWYNASVVECSHVVDVTVHTPWHKYKADSSSVDDLITFGSGGRSSNRIARDGASDKASRRQSSARTTKLDLPCCDQAFDPKGVYSDPQELDLDHPNRIDRYGSLFQDDEDEAEPGVWKAVTRLKNELIHLARMQQKFMERLDHPVQVSQTVMPGEPGCMGARGKCGVCVCVCVIYLCLYVSVLVCVCLHT